MTTMSATVTNIRRMLKDVPLSDAIPTAPTSTSGTTMTATTSGLWRVGQTWEFDDGGTSGAEQVLVTAVSGTAITIRRGYNGSTAQSHSNAVIALLAPRFPFDEVAQAVNQVLDSDLFSMDVFDIIEHQVTSSSTTNAYNVPSATCKRILNIYQRVNTTDVPTYVRNFRDYQNADTSLWAGGKVFEVYGNNGTPGTALYYVNCAEKLAIGTLTSAQERIVHAKAAFYLLHWEDIRRTAGPTNQADRSVRVGDMSRLAAFYNDEYLRLARQEAADIARQTPPTKRFVRNR